MASNATQSFGDGGAATGTVVAPPVADSPLPAAYRMPPVKSGMLCFLLSEVAFFSTLITTYVVFLRETVGGSPSPKEVFHLPLVLAGTACLLSSSVTIHFAEHAFKQGQRGRFLGLWGLTIVLGTLFLVGTGKEWSDLIGRHNLGINTNLFGSTYFTLVGFHALHVTVGLIVLSIVWYLSARRQLTSASADGVQVVSWYWHFVDAVWLVVFTLVYIVGR